MVGQYWSMLFLWQEKARARSAIAIQHERTRTTKRSSFWESDTKATLRYASKSFLTHCGTRWCFLRELCGKHCEFHRIQAIQQCICKHVYNHLQITLMTFANSLRLGIRHLLHHRCQQKNSSHHIAVDARTPKASRQWDKDYNDTCFVIFTLSWYFRVTSLGHWAQQAHVNKTTI